MSGAHGPSDIDRPTERTALLASRIPEHTLWRPLFPPVEPVLSQLQAKGIDSCSNTDWCPHPLPTRAATTAFSLIVLLELRARYSTQKGGIYSDIWGQWTKEEQNAVAARKVDQHVLSVWSQFLEEDLSAQEIEDALWIVFPFTNTEGTNSLRVVDLLSRHSVPEDLLTHRIVYLSLFRVWKYGRSNGDGQRSGSMRLLHRFDRTCTPRVMHTVDLMFRLLYLTALAYFVLLPPARTVESAHLPLPDLREGFLILYSAANVARSWSLSTTPFILTLLAFLLCLPTVPFPDNTAYTVLLFAFSWHILELHLSIYPSPVFWFPFERVLPLAVLIWHGISRIFLPVVTFFLPALLLSLFLLSTSLSDMFPQLYFGANFDPAPMETRVAFLSLFSVLFLLLLSSLVMLVLVYPSLSTNSPPPSPWDRYSKSVGFEARRAFMQAVVTYSSPHVFPSPFNLVRLLTTQIPAFVLSVLGRKAHVERLRALEGILWRIVVAPIGCIVAGLWLWGLREF